jgi:hypothetical protein
MQAVTKQMQAITKQCADLLHQNSILTTGNHFKLDFDRVLLGGQPAKFRFELSLQIYFDGPGAFENEMRVLHVNPNKYT